ncbi:hypothetical protein [Streptomyces sp. NPDC055060]
MIDAVRNSSSSRAEDALRALNTAQSTAAKRECWLKTKELTELLEDMEETVAGMRQTLTGTDGGA